MASFTDPIIPHVNAGLQAEHQIHDLEVQVVWPNGESMAANDERQAAGAAERVTLQG